MTAPLATLAFLVPLWMFVVVGAAILEQSGGKIIAALKGKALHAGTVPIAVRARQSAPAAQRPMRAEPRMRAAA